MKLYYTPNSPYARMCRIVAELNGLSDEIELEWVTLRTKDNPVIALSPLGRVPVLNCSRLRNWVSKSLMKRRCWPC